MTETTASAPARRAPRFSPRTNVRAQLIAASLMWSVGASILLFRGFWYVHDRSWHAWVLGAALAIAIAIPKSRYILDRVATKGVARIYARGSACFFGFFSWKTWLFIGLMMGGGIMIRNIFVAPDAIGAGILGALYLGIGAALALADRIFWRAALSPLPRELPAD